MPCLQHPVDSNVSQKNGFLRRLTGGFVIRYFLIATLLTTTSGCSLFVMAGKALFGDPKATSALTAATGISLEESKQPVVIICSIPARMMDRFPSLQIDLVDRLTRNMAIHDIDTVPSGDVARWYDDNGEWGDYSELAKHFKAQHVIHVEVRVFDHIVEESETLMQGKCEGEITMHQIQRPKSSNLFEDTTEQIIPINQVFFKDFKTQFPASYPVPRESKSEEQFIRLFMDRVALHIGQQIYSYQLSESVH
ncbi:MAG: hypothetical protein ABJZ55_14555 [Fuerstiella sp.]